MWLRDIMGGIGGLTTDLTQQAREQLTSTFGGTSENFAIFPTSYDLEAGKGIRMSGGVKNTASDGKGHKFVINVIPAAASPDVCQSGDISSCTIPSGENLKEFMKSWLTWDKTIKPIGIGKYAFFWLKVDVPPNAPKGTYIFNVYACYDGGTGTTPSAENCNENTPIENIWSTPKQLVITVK